MNKDEIMLRLVRDMSDAAMGLDGSVKSIEEANYLLGYAYATMQMTATALIELMIGQVADSMTIEERNNIPF
jgi:tmRNA-binding protein